MPTKFTCPDIDLLRKLADDSTISNKDLCNHFGVKPNIIAKWLKQYKINRHACRNNEGKDPGRDVLHELYVNQNMSLVDISKQVGVSNVTICKYLKKYNIKQRTRSQDQSLVSYKLIGYTQEKYGVDFICQSQYFKDKSKETMLQKHGVEYPSQSKVCRDKTRKTCLQRYGVENPGHVCLVKKSKGEIELMEALNSRGFNFISTKSVLSGRFELDGYDETRKLAVEYCGIHWHSEKRGRDRNYHYKKWKECYDKGIKLYTIFCDEWRESKNKIIDFITNPEIKIYARKTEFKEVPKGIAQKFCDDYHIESSAGVKFAYGLYYNNELCSVMTFENHHRNFKKLTMNRFCTKSNMIIIGGASKIMSNVYNIIQEPIITWSDNRWSDGDVYKKMGCKYDGILKPEYSWVKGKNRFSKQSRSKKRTGQPMHMTEKEYNESLDMSRIWDCGKIRWIYEGK